MDRFLNDCVLRTLYLKLLALMILLSGCLAEEIIEGDGEALDFKGAESAVAMSSTSIRISWTIAKSSVVSGYRIYSMDSALNLTPIGVASTSSSGYTVDELEPETKYYYVVRALTDSSTTDENMKFVSATTLEPEPLSVSPESKNLATSEILKLKASGGKPPYLFSIISGSGIVDTSTGEFVAPSTAGLTTIRVTDSESSVVIANITVVSKVKIEPSYRQLQTDRKMILSASSGTPPYSFAIIGGSSLATLDTATNTLTPSGSTGLVTVRVTDGNGITDDATVSIVSEYYPKMTMTTGFTACVAKVGLSGNAKCWGSNVAGKLGLAKSPGSAPGTMGDNLPELTFGSESVIDVAISWSEEGTPCAVLSNGNVKCWGAAWTRILPYSSPTGQSSQVGDAFGDINGVSELTFGSGRSVVSIDTMVNAFCVLLDNSRMKCYGDNTNEMLLTGDTSSAITGAGNLGDALPYLDLGTGRTVKSFSSGAYHVCAILDNDRLKCWGDGNYGKLGTGNTSDLGDSPSHVGDSLPYVSLGTGRTVKKVSAGYNHTCVILDNDQVKCWGYGGHGRLGTENTNNIGDSPGEMGDSLAYVNLGTGRTAKDIMAGSNYTCALLDNDKVKCFGDNTNGQIGSQSTVDLGSNAGQMGDALPYVDLGSGRTVRKLHRVKNTTACATLDNFQTKCWGSNSSGQIGIERVGDVGNQVGQMGDNLPSIDVGTGRTIEQITNADKVTCAVLDNGKLKCWGPTMHGSNGQDSLNSIGDEPGEESSDLADTVVSETSSIVKIKSGEYNTCALLADGTLKCWGRSGYGMFLGYSNYTYGDIYGQMGENLPAMQVGSTEKVIDFDYFDGDFICALLDTQKLKCWGRGDEGALGHGATYSMGGTGIYVGDGLPYVDLGSGRTVKSFSRSANHVCAILDNDKIKCWGSSNYGQLGTGNTSTIGDGPGEMGDNLPYVDVGTGVTPVSIVSGYASNCILTTDNKVRCWGRNSQGQLGLGHENHIGDDPGEMGDNLQDLDFGTTEKIVKLEAGSYSYCALFESERVKCWGSGAQGRIASGSSTDVGDAPNEMGSNLNFVDLGNRRVKDLFMNLSNTCFQLENDDLTCFGLGTNGQLRTGNASSLGDNASELGASIHIIKQD